nr:MAG TPA: hypothetical protein [Caudoviricetes sp.]
MHYPAVDSQSIFSDKRASLQFFLHSSLSRRQL